MSDYDSDDEKWISPLDFSPVSVFVFPTSENESFTWYELHKDNYVPDNIVCLETLSEKDLKALEDNLCDLTKPITLDQLEEARKNVVQIRIC